MIAISIGVVCFGIMTYLSDRFTERQFEKFYQEKALLIWKHIIHEIEGGMLLKDHAGILDTLKLYRTYNEVIALRIFSAKGKEAFAGKQGPGEH